MHGVYLGSSLKVQVMIDTSKPLRQVTSVRHQGEVKSSWYELDYVKLPVFCYYCGLLSHDSNICELHQNDTILEPQFDALMCAKKRDKWLEEKLAKEAEHESEPAVDECWTGCRFGLIEKAKSGWAMQVPDFPISGMVRSRSEWEDDGVSLDGNSGMEIDS